MNNNYVNEYMRIVQFTIISSVAAFTRRRKASPR